MLSQKFIENVYRSQTKLDNKETNLDNSTL